MSELSPQRLGKLTASMAAVIMGGLKTDGLDKYVRRLAGERIHGDLGEDGYTSALMDRGNEVESDALDWYEFHTWQVIERGPYIEHSDLPYVSATPDALIRGVKTIEAKSPTYHVWSRVKETMEVPSEYRWQCRWQMWCCGVTECDFVAWHPKPRGVVVPFRVTNDELDQMRERAILVEMMIREKVEILCA